MNNINPFNTNKNKIRIETVCQTIADLLSIFSFLFFLGDAISYSGSGPRPSMINLMFGGISIHEGGKYQWHQYDVFTFLFIWQMIILFLYIIRGIILNVEVKRSNNNQNLNTFINRINEFSPILFAIMSLVALIISFCSLLLAGDDFQFYFNLGFGPILYSIFHIFAFVLFFVSILLKFIITKLDRISKKNKENDINLDLILKYKKLLDEGVINQEEFDKKKEDLL